MRLLLELEEKERIPLLLKIIEDSSWRLRELAARELAGFGARVVPRLLKVVRSSLWYARAAACFALGEIGDIRAFDPMVDFVKTDSNPTVLREACISLAKILLKNLPFLKDRLEEEFWTRFINHLKVSDQKLYEEITKKQ